jgi:hypothetical protein
MTAWLRLTLLGAALHGVQSAAAATPAQAFRSCQQARSLWRILKALDMRQGVPLTVSAEVTFASVRMARWRPR